MTWLYLTLFSVITSAISNILRTVVMKHDKSDPYASVVVFQFMGFFIILSISFLNGFTLPPIQVYPLHFLAQAVLWGLSSLFLFKASKLLEASEITILSTTSSMATIITAVIFLGEVFNLQRVFGTLIIIVAVLIVTVKRGVFAVHKGFWYAVLSSVCAGLAVTNDTFLLNFVDVYSFLVVGWLSPGLFLIVVNPKVIKRIPAFFNFQKIKKLLLMTVFYATGGVAFYMAISSGGQASQVSPIGQSSIILTILLATVFLKEKSHLFKKIISAVLVTIGVILLS